MFKAGFTKYTLHFKRPAGTSRGTLTDKDCYFIYIDNAEIRGIGECSYIKGLSPDNLDNYEEKLKEICQSIQRCRSIEELMALVEKIPAFPSIQFGLETAILDLKNGGRRIIFDSAFSRSQAAIRINGLIWMGSHAFMEEQVSEKIAAGFDCIKMKIGAIDFESELDILRNIRNNFPADQLTLRVDANGAFSPEECMEKLSRLSVCDLHSIEQPIKQGQWKAMSEICATSPFPIALDEELIGIHDIEEKKKLLDTVKPQYIILKPSLMGGFSGCNEWISLANERNTGWWITSALESNIGLNAIAQWTFTLNNSLHQGLGTGMLYTNNIPSPLYIENGLLKMNSDSRWNINEISFEQQ